MADRNGWLARSVLAGMFGLLMATGGWTATELKNRIDAIDTVQKSRTDSLSRFESDISNLRADICRLEDKVDNLREDITHHPVHRMPCP